ncbi:T9SS type A sorting domain-containing protein [Salinibacter ruber]|uniref:T9SS type A sorting domain-containing protein n=1 Tax=Salinibacter ruber TaxID=146919 RepID=UPI002168B95A|nr:T9SS type A sorting domain-containing protein [Salinibacter ruber]MCS3648536.1 hypothetical protein [Salinibacter ruber]
MNVPKLLRTAFFSVLALVVAAGMAAAPAQAQDDIFVDDAGNDSQAGSADNPIRTLEEAFDRVDEDGDDVIIRGGDYTGGADIPVNYAVGLELTEADDGATTVSFDGAITFNPEANGSATTVEITSSNGGSLAQSGDITLSSGEVNIDASSTVALASGVEITRSAGEITGSAPTFGSNVNLTYSPVSDATITSGLEVPSDGSLGSGNLNVESGTVNFDQSVAAGSFDLSNSATANFQGNDLTAASGDVSVGTDQSLTVNGQLSVLGENKRLSVNGSYTGGDVRFATQSSDGSATDVLDGNGTADIDELTVALADGLVDDMSGTSVEAEVKAAGASADFTVGTVSTDLKGSTDDGDGIRVNLDAGDVESTISVSSGSSFGAIEGNSSGTINIDGGITVNEGVTNDGGTINVNADGATFVGDVNSSGTGTIDIASGNTLTVETGIDANGDNVAASHQSSSGDGNGFVGEGTVEFAASAQGGDGHTISTGGNFPNVVVSGPSLTVDGGITVNGNLNANTLTTANSDITVTGDLEASAEFDIASGATVTGNGTVDFRDATIDESGTLAFDGSSSTDFFPGNSFEFGGNLAFNKEQSNAIVTLQGNARVDGDITVLHNDAPGSANPALNLNDNDLFLGGTFELQGVAEEEELNPGPNGEGRVVFEDGGSIEGSGGYSNIAIANTQNDNDVQVPGGETVSFHGTLTLTKEGVTIVGTDGSGTSEGTLQPRGENAEIRRVVGGTGTAVGQNTLITDNTPTNDPRVNGFNPEQTGYSVAYGQNGGSSVSTTVADLTDSGSELTAVVTDLTVEEGAGVDLTSDFATSGVVTVDGQLATDNGSGVTLNGADPHVVTGALTAGVTAAASGTTIQGFEGDGEVSGGDDALLGTVNVAGDASLAIDGIKKVDGALTANSGSSVDLGLAADGDLENNTLLGSQPTQAITGNVDIGVGGAATLSLGSRALVTSDVTVSDNASAIEFGDSNLVVRNSDFDGADSEDVSYAAGSGALVMQDTNGSVNSLSLFGEAIPNLRVTDATDNNTTAEGLDISNAEVSETLTTERALDNSGNTVTFTGTLASIGAAVNPEFNVESGATVRAETGSASFTDVIVDAGSENEVTVESADVDAAPFTVEVSSLDLQTGGLNHNATTLSVNGGSDAFTVGSDFDPSSSAVTSSSGYIEFDNGSLNTNLASDVAIDRLKDLQGAAISDDSGTLTVTEELWLNAEFTNDPITVDGSEVQPLTIGNGATIRRTDGSTGGALTAVPNFGSEVNLGYEEINDTDPEFASGREVPSAGSSVSIDSIGVEVGGGEVAFERAGSSPDFVSTGNVIVNGIFDLRSGTVVHGIEGDDNSRLLEVTADAIFAQKDGSLDDDDADLPIETADGYTLRYYPNDGDVTTSDQEFRPNVGALEFIDGPVSSPSDDNLELHADREVGALTVNRSGASTLDLTSGPSDDTERTLTVTGGSDLTAGTVNNGTLQAEGDVTVDGGDIGNSATLAFAGSGDQSLSLNGDEELGNLSLAKTTPEGEVVPRVTVTGGGLDTDPDNENGDNSSSENQLSLSNGLLVIEGENDLDLGTVGFSRDLAEGDTSHVVGSVTRRVSDANAVAEYPVGSSNASYRPFGFIFTQAPTQATDITVTHVDENPGETGNLPITDNENVTVGENYPDYYWATESSNRLSISGEYEAFAQAEGLPFPDQSAQDFRIIQRAGSGSDWSLVGDGTGYDNTPISESEGRVDVSTVGATADIRQSPTRFTVGVPTQAAGFQIAGTVSYPSEEGAGSGTPSFTSGEGLGGVEVALVDGGSDVATTTTSSDGSFTFEDVEALDSGNYTVEARTDGDGNLSGGDVDQGISIADARRIVTARQEDPAFANAGFQGEIADVNDNGSANSLDALLVARNVVFGDALSEVPAFFAPSEQASAGDSEVGLQVAAYGDANLSGGSGSNDANNTSLTASQSAANLSGSLAQGSAQTSASSESQTAAEDRTIEVPVRLQEAAALGAYEMKLGFPADAVSFEGASVPTGAEGDLLSKAEDGTVKLGWIGSSSEEAFQVDRGGEVAVLTFALKDGVEETSLSLSLESGQLVGPDASTLEGASLGLPSLSSVTVAPEKFALNGNYPNPVSNGQTQIEMDLPSEGTVTVEVYNALGQRVMKSRKSMQAGSGQTIRINGSDLASGQYFYRVEAELGEKTARETGRITVVN